MSQFYNYAGDGMLYGIAMCTNISFFLNFIILHIYLTVVTKKPYKFIPIKGLNVNMLIQDIRKYLKLGFHSALMTYFDFWIYTILLFLS